MTSFADPGSGPSMSEQARDVQVNLNADVSGYTAQVGAAQQQTAALEGSVSKLGATMGNLAKIAGKKMFHFAAADFAGLGVAVADAAMLERQLSTLTATSVVTGTSMSAMKGQLDATFATFPVARRQIVELAETIANLGVTAPKAIGAATQTYLKLGAATGESAPGLAAGSLQLNRQMGNTDPGQVDGYANSLLTVSKQQGVAASGVLEFAQNIAPMARAAGIGEAAVLGISAAFQKAGADGAYAANTFNKVITEITTLKQTGSPELAKYATFVGKSPKEFASQSGTEQATQLFSQIGKGGPEALNFMSSIGLGPRDLKAVQAVAQQGGIGQAVAQATGSATNTKNLDSASAAAFGGLSDSVIQVGNLFTQLGEIIGGPLIGPINMAVEAFGGVVSLINKILSAMGPIPGIVAALAGALAIPAGMALTSMGAIGSLALARTMFGKQSAGRVALAEGREAAGRMAGGMTQQQAMMAGPVGTRIQAGRDPMNPMGPAGMRYTVPYATGLAAGAKAPSPANTAARGAVGRVVGGAFGAGTWLVKSNQDILRDQGKGSPLDKSPSTGRAPFMANVHSGSAMGFLRATGGLVTDTAKAGASMGAAATGKAASMAAAGVIPPRVRAAAAAGAAPVAAAAAAGGGVLARASGALFSPLGMIATMVAVPLIGSVVSAIKEGNAARKDMLGGGSGAAKYDQALDKTSSHLARFGDNVTAAAYSLAKFATMPLDKIGKVTGEDINAVTTKDYAVSDERLTGILKGAVETESKPGADQETIKKTLISYIKSIAQESGTGPISTDRLAKIRRDSLSILGTGQEDLINETIDAYVAAPGAGGESVDYGGLTSQATKATTPEGYKENMDAVVRGIQSATQDSGQEGVDSRIAQGLHLGETSIGGGPGQEARNEGFAGYLGEFTGVDPEEFLEKQREVAIELGTRESGKPSGRAGGPGYLGPYKTAEDAARVNPRAFARTAAGQDILKQRDMDEDAFVAWAQDPKSAALPPVTASGAVQSLTKAGRELNSLPIQGIGVYAANDAKFQAAATGADSGKASAEFAAAQKLVGETAQQSGGNLSTAAANLRTLSDHMGGANDATGRLIASAAAWADKLQQFASLDLSPQEQYNVASEKSATDRAAAALPGASEETVKKGQSSHEAFIQVQESEKQSMIGKIKTMKAAEVQQERSAEAHGVQVSRSNRDFATQQAHSEYSYGVQRARAQEDFGTQRARAEYDYNVQVSRSQEDFGISQARAAEDHYRQRSRAQEDFGTQQARAQHDFGLQVFRAQEDYQTQALRSQKDFQRNTNRQNEDHARDLRRQALASAQDIYDPFSRIQTKAVTDAGTLIYNLKEQNADIERQISQIQELKARGLSQDAIDTLKLSEAGNAQQVRALSMSLEQNPDMVGQINEQVGKRRASTTQLTQNPANVAFRQGEEDFARAMARASEDFSTMQQRAADDQGKTMQRMSDDFATSTARAAEDNSKSMSRMSEDFATSSARAAEDQGKSLARMADDFATSQARAAEDNSKSMQRMFEDFVTSQAWAAEAHGIALADMAADYDRTTRQAAEDLATSMVQYNGNFATIMSQLVATASGSFRKHFPAAADLIIEQANRIKQALTPMQQVISSAFAASGQPNVGTLGPNMGIPQHAFGGISMSRHQGVVAEYGPEAIIPLNSRGETFMAGLIAKAMVQGVTAATSGGPVATSTSMSSDNSISFAGADIRVEASDPNAMAKALAAKAKLGRLATPVRH